MPKGSQPCISCDLRVDQREVPPSLLPAVTRSRGAGLRLATEPVDRSGVSVDIELNLNTETLAEVGWAEPLCVEPSASIREVFELLKARCTGGVLVCRDGTLVGIFTERDALKLMAQSADLTAPIETVMATSVVTLTRDAKVGQAINRMSEGGYRRLPIIDEANRPIGILKVSGIVRYLVEHFPKAVYNQPPAVRPAMMEREGA